MARISSRVWNTVALVGALAAARLACADIAVPTGFADEVVVTGLTEPTALAWLPDGRLLVTEKDSGNIRLVVGGALVPTPVFTVPEVETLQLEEGLLGMTVDPAYPDRPYLYVYFTHAGTQTNFLVMYTLTGDLTGGGPALSVDPASRYAILTDIVNATPNHNGGGLHFAPDGRLLLSLGDDNQPCAVRANDLLGSALLRLDVSALPQADAGPPDKALLVAADNPFVGDGNPNVQLMAARGLRNPFSFHVDPATGRIFIADVGLSSYEEIDLVEPGAPGPDFGWPWFEGPAPASYCLFQNPPEETPPIFYYDRTAYKVAAVISGGLYRAMPTGLSVAFPPEYDGDYFFADSAVGFMRRLTEAPDGTWSLAAPALGQPDDADWATGLSGAVQFAFGPDGALYYLSRTPTGSLHRIVSVSSTTTSTTTTSTTETTTSTTTIPPVCAPTPATDCLAPITRGSLLRLRVAATLERSRLTWKWVPAQDVSIDFGDPADTTGYALCVYDDRGLLTSAAAPAGGLCGGRSCWTVRTTSARYGNPVPLPDGFVSLALSPGNPPHANIVARLKGPRITLAAPPLVPPIRIQLRRTDTGSCWDASYRSTLTNTSRGVKARSD